MLIFMDSNGSDYKSQNFGVQRCCFGVKKEKHARICTISVKELWVKRVLFNVFVKFFLR